MGSSSLSGSDNFLGALAEKVKEKLAVFIAERAMAKVKRGVVCTNVCQLSFTPDRKVPQDDPSQFYINLTFYLADGLFLVLNVEDEKAHVLCLFTGETGTVQRSGLVPYE